MAEQIRELTREKDEWRQTFVNKVEQIKQLESELNSKSQDLAGRKERVHQLEEKKVSLIAHLAKSDMARKNMVKDLIPKFVSLLLASVEYRKSLVVSIGLSFSAGWLGGIGVGQKEDEIEIILKGSKNVDIEELIKVTPDTPSSSNQDDATSIPTAAPQVEDTINPPA
nr:hypothetical protein [Tanacetum cinerariifolium]